LVGGVVSRVWRRWVKYKERKTEESIVSQHYHQKGIQEKNKPKKTTQKTKLKITRNHKKKKQINSTCEKRHESGSRRDASIAHGEKRLTKKKMTSNL